MCTMVLTPMHDFACEGLPNGQPCPRRRKGEKENVCYNHNMLNLCPECSKAYDDERDGVTRATPLVGAGNANPAETRTTRSRSNQPNEDDDSCVIHDPVLCYVASSRDTSRRSDISHLVAAYFAEDLINEAKSLLWKRASRDVIGDLLRRKTTDERTRKEANAQDIYDAMKKLEDKSCLPEFGVKSHQWHLMPKVKPCELLDYSITERMTQLETKFERMSESIDLLSNQNSLMRTELASVSRPRPTAESASVINIPTIQVDSDDVTNGLPRPVNIQSQSQRQNSRGSDSYAGKLKPSAKASKSVLSKVPDPFKGLRVSLGTGLGTENSGSVTSLVSDDAWPDIDSDSFQLPGEQQRRMQRADNKDVKKRRRPQKVIKGKGEEFKSLKGSEPNRDIYVYRLLLSTTEEDVREFLSDAQIVIRNLVEITDPKWSTKSYRVSLPSSQLNTALELEWPLNVCVRKWRFVPRKDPKT